VVLPHQAVMERAVVLGYGANQAMASPALASLVNEYSSLLASQARARCPFASCAACACTHAQHAALPCGLIPQKKRMHPAGPSMQTFAIPRLGRACDGSPALLVCMPAPE
jgi:hypothetical protein